MPFTLFFSLILQAYGPAPCYVNRLFVIFFERERTMLLRDAQKSWRE